MVQAVKLIDDCVLNSAPENFEENTTYVRPGEETDIRVAKRKVDSFERFMNLVDLRRVPEPSDSEMTLFEIFDLMRNHVTNDIAD